MASTTPAPTKPTLVFRVRNGEQRLYLEVQADDVAEGRAELERRGYQDIHVIKDVMSARIDESTRGSEVWKNMTLEERIAFEQKMLRPPSAIRTVWQFLKTEGLIIGLIILWVTMAIISRNPWSRSSLVAYVSAIGYAVFSIGVRVPVRWYGRLLEARLWHRWDDVDRAVARLRRGRTFGGGAIPEWELIFSEARAMAGRGHLAAALEKVRPLEKSGTMAAEIYYSYLGALYEIAGDYKSKVVAIGQAVAANPKSLQTRIDLAFTLGAMLRDWEAAREALSGVNPADLVPMARIYLGFVEGVMALDEGRLPEAEKAIREAREGWRQFEGHQLAKGVGWLMKGFHAIALRRLGKNAEAEAEFAAVKFYLQQTEADFVFSRWEGR